MDSRHTFNVRKRSTSNEVYSVYGVPPPKSPKLDSVQYEVIRDDSDLLKHHGIPTERRLPQDYGSHVLASGVGSVLSMPLLQTQYPTELPQRTLNATYQYAHFHPLTFSSDDEEQSNPRTPSLSLVSEGNTSSFRSDDAMDCTTGVVSTGHTGAAAAAAGLLELDMSISQSTKRPGLQRSASCPQCLQGESVSLFGRQFASKVTT